MRLRVARKVIGKRCGYGHRESTRRKADDIVERITRRELAEIVRRAEERRVPQPQRGDT